MFNCDNSNIASVTISQLCDGVNDCGNDPSADESSSICDSMLTTLIIFELVNFSVQTKLFQTQP